MRYLLIFLFSLFCNAQDFVQFYGTTPVGSPITLTRFSGNSNYTGVSTLSVANFQVNGLKKLLIVTIMWDDFSGTSLTGVHWDTIGVNEALTQQYAGVNFGMAVYSKIAPTDATSDIKVDFSGASSSIVVGVLLLNGANQTTPFGPFSYVARIDTEIDTLVNEYTGCIILGVLGNSVTTPSVSFPFTAFNPIYHDE